MEFKTPRQKTNYRNRPASATDGRWASGLTLDSRLLVLVIVAMAAMSTTLFAETFAVNKKADTFDGVCNGDCSLRDAVYAANGSSDPFNMITVPADTYSLSLAGSDEDSGVTGDLDIAGRVLILGTGAATTTIDASGLGDRVVDVHPGSSVAVRGVTFTGGTTDHVGGGLRLSMGSLILKDSVVSGNSAELYGGGIYNNGGDLTIEEGSWVSGNSSTPDGAAGGVYCSDGSLTMTSSTVHGNQASSIGGVWSTDCDLSITASTISGNSAVGGIYGGVYVSDPPSLGEIINSTIVGNSAVTGSGLVVISGTLELNGVTISDNTDSAANSVDVTLGTTAQIDMVNTIIDGDCSNGGVINSNGGNIESPRATCRLGGNGMSVPDLMLGTLRDNGGPTQTIRPRAGSPALGYGHIPSCLVQDQRGFERTLLNCDSGSIERIVMMADGFESGDTSGWSVSISY